MRLKPTQCSSAGDSFWAERIRGNWCAAQLTNDALHTNKVGQILCCTQAIEAWAVLSAKYLARWWWRATA